VKQNTLVTILILSVRNKSSYDNIKREKPRPSFKRLSEGNALLKHFNETDHSLISSVCYLRANKFLQSGKSKTCIKQKE
jgi:hypothetical protein